MKANDLLVRLIMATVFACCCVSVATAQNMNIRGRVYDKRDSQPVSNAFITIEKETVSNQNGYFELGGIEDSLRLSVRRSNYLRYHKMLPGNYEGDWDIFLEQIPGLDTMIIRYGSTPRGIMGGKIFDKEGNPVEGATVIITGKDLPAKVMTSDSQGSFWKSIILPGNHRRTGKNNIYTHLDIFVHGHKPFDYRFRRIDKPSKRVKHDGLIIEIDFHE